MIKPIVLSDDDKSYTLEFDRITVKFAESKGFVIGDVEKYPLTKIYELFFYAFRKHHPKVSKAETDKIIDDWGGIQNIPDGVLERLGQLYIAPFSTLVDEEERKNAGMTVEM